MKRILPLILALVLIFLFSACGGEKTAVKDLDAASLADSLLKGNIFSVSLDELPSSKASAFYGVEKEKVEDALLYHASGVSKEQIVVLKATDETAAADMASTLRELVQEWIQTDTDYAPQEVPKLEKTVLRQSGVWVVMVVANDPDTAAKLVGEFF